MSPNESKIEAARFATPSIRTLLLVVAVIAAYLGVFVSTSYGSGPYPGVGVILCMVVLLNLVCTTFASIADDLWHDLDATFVAALFGFLGYAAMVALGTLFPVAARFVDAGFAP